MHFKLNCFTVVIFAVQEDIFIVATVLLSSIGTRVKCVSVAAFNVIEQDVVTDLHQSPVLACGPTDCSIVAHFCADHSGCCVGEVVVTNRAGLNNLLIYLGDLYSCISITKFISKLNLFLIERINKIISENKLNK